MNVPEIPKSEKIDKNLIHIESTPDTRYSEMIRKYYKLPTSATLSQDP